MKKLKIFESRILLVSLSLICLITITHFITYAIDKRLITLDKEPRFCINTGTLKDGGTKIYYGLGYQIIKWNSLSEKMINGEMKNGISHGYEMHRLPYFVDWINGPNIDLKFKY